MDTSNSSHNILTKFTKLRKRPQQPLTDLTELYSKIANESIYYLKLEDQKQYSRALLGWKALTTDAIFQLTRIEHAHPNQANFTKDDLSLQSGVKELYYKALTHMERVQESVDKNKLTNTTSNTSTHSTTSSLNSSVRRPVANYAMSRGFPRLTLRDKKPRIRQPDFPFANYFNPSTPSSVPSIPRNNTDNTITSEKKMNFTPSKPLDYYDRDQEMNEEHDTDSDKQGVSLSQLSATSSESKSLSIIESNTEEDKILIDLTSNTDSDVDRITEKLTNTSSGGLNTQISTGPDDDDDDDEQFDFDVTDYYSYLDVNDSSDDDITSEKITCNPNDIVDDVGSKFQEFSFESNNDDLNSNDTVHPEYKPPIVPNYVPPIPEAPPLIKIEKEETRSPYNTKQYSNEGDKDFPKRSNGLPVKKSHQLINQPTLLKQTRSTPALPNSKSRHGSTSKETLKASSKSSSTLSLGSKTSHTKNSIGSKTIRPSQVAASQQAARMVLTEKKLHPKPPLTTKLKSTSISLSRPSTAASSSSKGRTKNTSSGHRKTSSAKNKISPNKGGKPSGLKNGKKSKSFTVDIISSLDETSPRIQSNSVEYNTPISSTRTSRTNSALDGNPEETKSLKDSLEDKIIDSMSGVDKAAAKQIFQEIVVHGDKVSWEDIAGLTTAKNSLKEAVVYPFLRPDLFRGLREPITGMLLFGPPGTGKTMLARAVAFESKSTFFSISASSLTSKYLGESEKLVRALFSVAKKLAPSIIFVDEIDSILGSRNNDGENESSRRIKNEFLVQWSSLSRAAAGNEKKNSDSKMDGDKNTTSTNSESDDTRVLVLAATNLPWSIDEAARRRFVRRQYIPLPGAETRLAQFKKLLSHQKHTLTSEDFEKLVQLTDDYSGSDITSLAKDAAMGPLRELGDQLLFMDRDNIRPMGLLDFQNSLEYIKPSVSKEGLEKYEEWAAKFGSSGI